MTMATTTLVKQLSSSRNQFEMDWHAVTKVLERANKNLERLHEVEVKAGIATTTKPQQIRLKLGRYDTCEYPEED